jgi:hypothetical protein
MTTERLIILLLIGGLLFTINKCNDNKKASERLLDNVAIAQDSIRYYKDKSGQLVAQRETMRVRAQELASQAEALGLDKDRLKKQVGKLSNLVSYYRGELESRGTDTVVMHDTLIVDNSGNSLKAKTLNWSNGNLSLVQTYFPHNDSLKLAYSYSTGFELTTYYKRDFLFVGRRRLYADFRLTDPNAKLLEATSVFIEEPPKKFYEKWWFWGGVGLLGGMLLK